jgi:hypothetical protein
LAACYDAFGARVLQTGTTTTFYPFKWYSSKLKYFPSQICRADVRVRAALSARSLALWRPQRAQNLSTTPAMVGYARKPVPFSFNGCETMSDAITKLSFDLRT